MNAWIYDPASTTPNLRTALKFIAEDFPIKPGRRANVRFELAGDGPSFEWSGKGAVIRGATVPQALRALATLRGFARDGSIPSTHSETPRFTTLGVMWDQSRNAVAKVETVKFMLRRCALMGLNFFMLYTEDTYEVPGEPHIGYLRGRYTQRELRELDDYAHALGIEMIPCIQTLAHLSQMLRWWKQYGEVKGSNDFLYVGQPETYELIHKMIAAASAPYRSKRIHVGMDEAHGIGTGKFKAIPGERTEFDIMLQHLGEVVKITSDLGLRPMMWSDMFFTIAETDKAHGDAVGLLAEIGRRIPKEMDLVFWDYYQQDPDFYRKKILLHRAMGKEPLFAPGAWTDYVWWTHFTHARIDTDAGMLACKETGVREAFTTMWGDDGGSCNFISALNSIQHFAEHGYRDRVEDADLRRQFYGATGIDFNAWDTGRQIDITPTLAPTIREWSQHLGKQMPACIEHLMDVRGNDVFGTNPSVWLLWQDPMVGIFDHHIEKLDGLAAEYKQISAHISRARTAGAMEKEHLAFVHEIARVLELKADLGVRMRKAYLAKDRRTLKQIATRTIPELLRRVRRAHEAHRRQWFRQNKPNGWEVQDLRWSGLNGRIRSAQIRLNDYLAGRTDALPELAEARLTVSDFPKGRLGFGGPHYRRIVSPSVIT